MAVNERFDFSGRSVLITGGGKGIGKVYVEEFAKAGARVATADIDVAAAESVAASLTEAGLQAFGLGVDIADEASVRLRLRPCSIASAQSTYSSTTPR